MQPGLLPDYIEKLREQYRSLFASRPSLRRALETLLGDLDELWDSGAIPQENLRLLDAEVLPALLRCADPSLPAWQAEEAVDQALHAWDAVGPKLTPHP